MADSYIFIFILYGACVAYCDSRPEVTIAQGVLRGKYVETVKKRKIVSFEGIPFAKPPIGDLRFEEPVPADPWPGTLEATELPTHCIQPHLFTQTPEVVSGSEDCLYLNVYTPQVLSSNEQPMLDVIAHIHGGAFTAGTSWDYGPFMILDRDVVLVTFNYRLGPLGFLSTEDAVVPGNNGLKDQVLALKWIQQNIVAFGGDPQRVTVQGLSTGGVSCGYHLLSPLSKGLFKGAWCMSGSPLNPWAMAQNSRRKAIALSSYLNCSGENVEKMVGCLRKKSAKDIVRLMGKFMYNNTYPPAPFAPVIEPIHKNAFISDSPLNILKQKKAADVPVVFSFARDEGAFFLSMPVLFNGVKDPSIDRFEAALDYNHTVPTERRKEIRKEIEEFYKMGRDADIQASVKLLGDRIFVAGISKFVKVAAAHFSSPVYLYSLNYKGKITIFDTMNYTDFYPNAVHGDDVFFMLGMANLGNVDDKLTKEMQDTWLSFVANGKLKGEWHPVQEQLPKLVFTDIRGPGNFKLTVKDEIGEESFWDSLGLNENFDTEAVIHEEL